jgi:carbon monoxide dehydrogenase subunit G
MQLDSTFSVVAPVDTVWNTLMDFERVAGCVPGAQILNKLSDDSYQVGMKVKLGPVSMQYRGQMNVIERDAAGHRAVFQGRAQETRGQGTAEATVTLQLTETDGATRGTVNADISLSGKAAAMGKGVISSVTDQMMALFAENLQTMVTEPAIAPAPAEPTTTGATVPTAPPSAAPVTPSAPRPATAPAETSLNAVSLGMGMIAEQLKSPAKLAALIGAVGAVGFLLGRLGSKRKA